MTPLKTALFALATLACAPAHAATLADFNPIDLVCENVEGVNGHHAGYATSKVHIDTVGGTVTITARHGTYQEAPRQYPIKDPNAGIGSAMVADAFGNTKPEPRIFTLTFGYGTLSFAVSPWVLNDYGIYNCIPDGVQ